MSKSKRTSKSNAARKRKHPLRAPRNALRWMGHLVDPATGELFDSVTRLPIPPCPPDPPPTPEQIAARRERVRQRLARDEARRAAFKARESRRPREMQRDGYTLPADVAAFLRRLHEREPFYWKQEHITVAEARDLIEAAYMEGCRQGFIEGFLYGEDKARPGALKNRERLVQQNLDKLERLGIADRNAAIVAEFRRLERELPGKEERYQRLADEAKAEEPGRENWPTTARQIADIIRAAPKRRR